MRLFVDALWIGLAVACAIAAAVGIGWTVVKHYRTRRKV